jgi:hypothetical protein
VSLTEMLKLPDVRKRFNAEFNHPKITLHRDTFVSPSNPGHAQLIGTAFDYVLRFHAATVSHNVQSRRWVAEHAVDRLVSAIARRRPVFSADRSQHVGNRISRRVLFEGKAVFAMDRELSERECELPTIARRIIADAQHAYIESLEVRNISDELLRSSLLLAQLDTFYRSRILSTGFGITDDCDIQDLRRLLKVASDLPQNPFSASKICLLNPTFGEASTMVGGADADLLVDDTLIELKTTKKLEFSTETFNQLLGYYVLHNIGGIGININPKAAIRNIGMYSARFGVFVRIPIDSIVNLQTFPKFIRWFKRRALRGPTERNALFTHAD